MLSTVLLAQQINGSIKDGQGNGINNVTGGRASSLVFFISPMPVKKKMAPKIPYTTNDLICCVELPVSIKTAAA